MDSKMIWSYFAAVTKQPISYGKDVFEPRPLVVSALIFRGFTCPESCGACCTQPTLSKEAGTLNYLPGEERTYRTDIDFTQENVVLNGKSFLIYSEDMKPPTATLKILSTVFPCKHLTDTARCGIYEERSLACDLPLLQVTQRQKYNHLTIRKFGRHHLYKQFDLKTRGTKCELLGITPESTQDTRRRLRRLHHWTEYFQLKTWMPEIEEWAAKEPSTLKDLRLGF